MGRPGMRMVQRQTQSMTLSMRLLLLSAGIMSFISIVIFLGVSSLHTEKAVASIIYTTINTGSWTNTANVWSTNGISACGCTPGTNVNSTVIVKHNITVNTNLTIGSAGSLKVMSTGKITSNNTLTLSGNLETTGEITVKEFIVNSIATGSINGPFTIDVKFLDHGKLSINSLIKLNNGSIEFKSGSITTAGNDWIIDIPNGNLINEGIIDFGGTCLRISNGTFYNKSGSAVTGNGYIETENGNIDNSGSWAADIKWCASGSGSGLPSSQNCNACASSSTLPIQLIYFEGIIENNTSMLNWATATELNNDFFTIERSDEGLNFYKIGEVKGNNNSNNIIKYNFNDDAKSPGKNVYYRLSQTDFDGTTEYIKTICLKQANQKFETGSIKISPNPFNDNFIAQYKMDEETKLKVELINLSGAVVSSEEITSVEGLNIYNYSKSTELNSGIYILRFSAGDLIIGQHKIVKS